jgi:ubiquitin-like protein Pup
MKRVQEERETTKREAEEDPEPRTTDAASKAKEDIDDLLDEIDELLEENAEEFVQSYVQKGGE